MGVPLPHAFISATANTNIDGTGTIQTVFRAGQGGARLTGAVIKAQVATTAGFFRLYIGNGKRWALLDEITVAGLTPSASVKSFSYPWEPEIGTIDLAPGEALGAAPHSAETFTVHPIGQQLP